MKTLIFFLSLFAANVAFADAVGLRISGGLWSYEATGQIRDSANVAEFLDLKADLGIKDEEKFNGFLYLEHPVPILPNVRLGITDLKLAGNGTTNRDITWNGSPTIPSGTAVNSNVDLSHNEIGLYYEIWDTGFDFDLGLNLKFFDGTVNLSGGGVNASSSFDETIPMVYASVGIPLVAGFSLGGDLNYISYDGDKFQDYFFNVRWVSDFLLGVELGYRTFTVDYADGNEFADVEISGPYLNARFDF